MKLFALRVCTALALGALSTGAFAQPARPEAPLRPAEPSTPPVIGDAPFNVYLTYRGNASTSTSIVVNYHLQKRFQDVSDPVVHFDTQSRGGERAAYAQKTVGTKTPMAELQVPRTLCFVDLTGLQPNTTYYFVAGDDTNGYTEERSFRTIPAGDEPIRFVTGGDMNVTTRTERLLAQAGAQDPLFCAIGGDIPYANDRPWEYGKWDTWFNNYDTHLRTPDGHMVPMFVAIGNHETNKIESTDPMVKATFYTSYFGMTQAEGKTYYSQKFGKDIVFIALDSSHVVPHGGEQTAWLAETLAANEGMKYKLAIYHIPLYPSLRPYDGMGSALGRMHWGPVFDAYQLTVGFENHDHTLKRTKLLRDGREAEDGVLYIGDGCFGVEPRKLPEEEKPYLDVQGSLPHFWVVDVKGEGIDYKAIGEEGEVFDTYHQPARAQAPALAPAAVAAAN